MALVGSCQHKSPQVRAKVAGHLDALVQSAAAADVAGKVALALAYVFEQTLDHLQLRVFAGNKAIFDRVVKVAAAILDEGSQDARLYGKRVLWHCRQLADAQKWGFQKCVASLEGE